MSAVFFSRRLTIATQVHEVHEPEDFPTLECIYESNPV